MAEMERRCEAWIGEAWIGDDRRGAARRVLAWQIRHGDTGHGAERNGPSGHGWAGQAIVNAAQRHMAKIAGMSCICCRLLGMKQETRTYVHHIRGEDREQRSDFLTLPLCWPCHQGVNGIHMDKTYLRMLKTSEWGLLAKVIEELGNERRD